MSVLDLVANEPFLMVVDDPESYLTEECVGSTIVKTWTEAMFCPSVDAPPEEVDWFVNFANEPDNWRQDDEMPSILVYPVGGESNGTITFFRLIHKP